MGEVAMLQERGESTRHHLERLLERYSRREAPIQTDFRKLVPRLGSPDRFTHLIHPYPAKLLTHIPYFFVANDLLSDPGDMVLDPFAGSGTVLLEALLSGRHAVGADSNAMARLIARVKTTPLPLEDLESARTRLLNDGKICGQASPPDVINIEHWFHPHVIRQLVELKSRIDGLEAGPIRDFFLVCFSVCVRRVSLADPRLSVPVRLREDQYPDGHPLRDKIAARLRQLKRVNVSRVFRDIVARNVERMRDLSRVARCARATVICSDARNLNYEFAGGAKRGSKLPGNSVQLIVTSPPYPGAQKYVRAMRLSLGWLGLSDSAGRRTEKLNEIGREQYRKHEYESPVEAPTPAATDVLESIRQVNPLRAHICAQYLCEMENAFVEASRVLCRGGYFVLVAGNSKVCGQSFRTTEFLRAMAQQSGLSLILHLVDVIKSRGLMTKRNRTAGMILRENVLVFQK